MNILFLIVCFLTGMLFSGLLNHIKIEKRHECKEKKYCICRPDALEPNENCSIHGIPPYHKCFSCGKFMKNKEKMSERLYLKIKKGGY